MARTRGWLGLVLGGLAAAAGADPTAVAHDRIRFSLAGDWSLAGEGGILQGSLAGASDAGMIVWSAKDMGGRSLAEAFVAAVEASTRGRSVLKVNPPEPGAGQSRTGVPFVGQSRITKGAGGDVWYGLYYAFEVGGGAFQLLSFVAGSPATFKTLATASGAGLEGLTVEAPAPAAVARVDMGGRVGAPSGVFSQTGARSDEYVSGAFQAQSVRLEPVPFRTAFARRYEFLDTPQIGRGGDGTVYAFSPSTSSLTEAQKNLMRVPAQGPLEKTRFGFATLGPPLDGTTDYGRTEIMGLDKLHVVRDGSAFLQLSLYGTKHSGFVVARPSGAVEVVASPKFLAGQGKAGWGSTSFLEPGPDGRSAWLVFSNEGPANLLHLTTDGGGSWRFRRVQATFAGKPLTPSRANMAWGAADPKGGYLWHEKDSWYRLAPDGTVIQLLRMPIETDGVDLSDPVVLPNGDIWFGVATEYWSSGGGTVSGGAYTHRNTTFMVGDRSRLVRVRIDGQGRASLGEIGAEAAVAALRQAGVANGDSTVFKPLRLAVDHATGGLLLYDTHHGSLLAVVPGD